MHPTQPDPVPAPTPEFKQRPAAKPPSEFERTVRQMAAMTDAAAHPRKPFQARGSFIKRCDGCRMPRDFCICGFRTPVTTQAEFWVLMHREELNKPTNTARLIGDTLPSSRVFMWQRNAPSEALLALLQDERYQPFVIFPDDQPDYQHRVVAYDQAREAQTARIPVFILLDGTWRQARRMFRKSPYLDHLPVLPVRSSRKTLYRLRKPASEAHLCTAEVGIALLEMAGETRAAQVLQHYFQVFNEGYAAARKQTPASWSESMQWLSEQASHPVDD